MEPDSRNSMVIPGSDKIAREVKSKGLFVIPSYLTGTRLQEIIDEFHLILDKEKNAKYSFGRAVRLINVPHKYQTTIKLFRSKFMANVAKSFYKGPHRLNTSVFLTHEHGKQGDYSPNGVFHADLTHSLKFLFYLTDIDESCGPFTCIPGSTKVGAKLRLSKNNRLKDNPSLLHLVKKAKPITGPAGTLIIFTTDLIHKGGRLSGGTRKVIRGHCRP